MRITAFDYSIVFLDGWGRSLEAQKRADIPHLMEIVHDLHRRNLPPNKRFKDRAELDELPRELLDRYADQGFIFEELMQPRNHARIVMPRHPLIVSPYEAMEIVWKRRTFLRRQSEANIVTPGELILDGIAGNPDCLNLDDESGEEYKNTYRSMKWMTNFVHEFREWNWQFMGYLHMMRESNILPQDQISRLNLIVRWVCGDYKGNKPEDKMYRLEYSQDEIHRNWSMILQHRDLMTREGKFKC